MGVEVRDVAAMDCVHAQERTAVVVTEEEEQDTPDTAKLVSVRRSWEEGIGGEGGEDMMEGRGREVRIRIEGKGERGISEGGRESKGGGEGREEGREEGKEKEQEKEKKRRCEEEREMKNKSVLLTTPTYILNSSP